MAKIILHNTDLNLSSNANNKTSSSSGYTSDRDILKKRSTKYVEYFSNLDHKSLSDTRGMSELLTIIHDEYGTAELESLPLGFVSKCFLGHPYEVHTLFFASQINAHANTNTDSIPAIINHYKIAENMPLELEKARGLAKHNAYVVIEVYKDKLILIRADGSTTKL